MMHEVHMVHRGCKTIVERLCSHRADCGKWVEGKYIRYKKSDITCVDCLGLLLKAERSMATTTIALVVMWVAVVATWLISVW